MVALNEYFEVAIRQHQERGRQLLARIPNPNRLPQEFYPLVQNTTRSINDVIEKLETILKDRFLRDPRNQAERLRHFRRAVQELSLLETTCVAALERRTDSDGFLSQLVIRITHEIDYPLSPPMVTGLSQHYFHIYPNFNLLFVPLTEGDFLLHLPDLYHEIGHTLVSEPYNPNRYNPKIKGFQASLLEMLYIVSNYLNDAYQKELRGRGPKQLADYFQVWKKSWWEWAVEFFCDLFAVYTVGPAFGWSHIHLYTKLGDNPFSVPLFGETSHPADHARMQTILCGLRLIDFGEAADKIEGRWNELLRISGAVAEPEYQRCFPDDLLAMFAQKAYEATLELKCQIVTPQTDQPIYSLLNKAWDVFWNEPGRYIEWERKAVEELRVLCSSKIGTTL